MQLFAVERSELENKFNYFARRARPYIVKGRSVVS